MIRHLILPILLLIAVPSFGDSIRPAYLEIIETSPGSIDVVWKIPKVEGLPPDLAPALPASFTPMTSSEKMDTSNSIVRKWSMIGPALNGQTIRIQSLENFTMEALARIELVDGTTIRTVLKPNAPELTLPILGKEVSKASTLPWLYSGLFAVAFGLSLTRPARQRGIALCSLALIVGSMAGNALGHRIPKQKQLADHEAQRILEGLMLNTYRAFIFDSDEEVYDILSRSVDGRALNQIFLENRSRLSFNDPEAAASMVDRLDIKSIHSIQKNKDGSLTMLTDWDVYGSVFHWEHVHFRCNAFKAKITIISSADYWKITNLNILEEERVL